MVSLDPKKRLHELTQPDTVYQRFQNWMSGAAVLQTKVIEIAAILKDCPALLLDAESMTRVFALTEKDHDPVIQRMREVWAYNACCHVEQGICRMDIKSYVPKSLQEMFINRVKDSGAFDVKTKIFTLSKNKLQEIGEAIWDIIKKENVQTLVIVIRDGDETFEYSRTLLSLLQEQKPPVSFLSEKATVIFSGDEKLTLSKAKLFACGETLSFLLTTKWSDGNSSINLTKTPVTPSVLNAILSYLETGIQDPKTPIKDLKIAMDFLNTSMLYPKGIIGPKEWEEFFGKVDDFPPPRELLQELNELRSQGKDPLVCLIPTHVSGKRFCHNLLAEKMEHNTKIRHFPKDDSLKDLKTAFSKNPYYILMDKSALAGTKGLSFNAQKVEVQKLGQSYHIPGFVEAETAILLHHRMTGERLFEDVYLRCAKMGDFLDQDYTLIVGRFTSEGLYVDFTEDDAHGSTGVAPILRFAPPLDKRVV